MIRTVPAIGNIRAKALILPFVVSIFLSATLLFLVQPLITKQLLPTFGGSPAVWNTALVFFQTVLLLGYLYAHALTRITTPRIGLGIHLFVILVSVLTLRALNAGVPQLDPHARPGIAVLGMLVTLVGAPFFVLSTNSSLVQYWWTRSGQDGSEDPYWLYGASNLGSLLALLSYPFLIERTLDLEAQSLVWSIGYGLFAALTLSLVLFAARASERMAVPAIVNEQEIDSRTPESPRASQFRLHSTSRGRVAMWAFRAAVGSSLLLSLTMMITTDVASVPLFWVAPLAVYLVTFILAFGFTDSIPRRIVESGTIVGLAASLGMLFYSASVPFSIVLMIGLGTLFFGALLCHLDLAADRPPPDDLTAFYLWISAGGALGGILNSLVAPLVFDSVAEYPLTLLALSILVCIPPAAGIRLNGYKPSMLAAVLAVAALVTPLVLQLGELSREAWAALGLLLALIAISSVRLKGFLIGLLFLSGTLSLVAISSQPHVIARERSFFGVVTITADDSYVTMSHGTTIHGAQNRDPSLRLVPGKYHHPDGPIGAQVVNQPAGARIGVVGLGAGALAALADSGQSMTFFEIDPLVVEMAHRHFTFLQESAGDLDILLGDGRLTLAESSEKTFDLLIVDAFTSDAIPIHLMTVEALQLYLSRTKPNGMVLLHISNRHVDLLPVLRGFSSVTGTKVAVSEYRPSEEALAEGASFAVVAVVAPTTETIHKLLQNETWSQLPASGRQVLWTDSRSDILSVLR
jgi:hypothetical protein